MRTIAAVLSLLLLAAAAADRFTGTWEADLTAESKTTTFVFHLKANGNAVTGSIEIPSADRVFPISKGTIAANAISFQAIGLWSGTLSGNELKLTRELDGGKKQHFAAHRTAP